MAKRSIPQADTTGDLHLPKRLHSAPQGPAGESSTSPTAQPQPSKARPSVAESSDKTAPIGSEGILTGVRLSPHPDATFDSPGTVAGGQPPEASHAPSEGKAARTQDMPSGPASQEEGNSRETSASQEEGNSQETSASQEEGASQEASSSQGRDQTPGAKGVAAAASAQAKEAREAEERQKREARARRFSAVHIASIVVAALLVLVLILMGLFTWSRWHRFDDAADLQGEWYVAGTDVPITISADAIRFDEKTSYLYVLDPETKSLTFSLANLEGQCHYRFAGERNYLVITDGTGFTKWGTAFGDLGADIVDFFSTLTGGELQLPSGEGIIVLSREPNSGAVQGAASASDASPSSSSTASSGGEASSASSGADGSGSSLSSAASPKDIFSEISDRKEETNSAASEEAGEESYEVYGAYDAQDDAAQDDEAYDDAVYDDTAYDEGDTSGFADEAAQE